MATSLEGTIQTVIVVPCFNEAERLDEEAFQQFITRNPTCHLLFVNDGSHDETLAALECLRDRCRPGLVSILDLPANGGKAEAIRAGFQHLFHCYPRVSFAGYLDADLATPLGEMERLIAVATRRHEVRLVMASRLSLLGRQIERRRSRHWCGRLFALATSMMLGMRIRDTQCGAKLFRVDDETQQLFVRPFISRWLFDVELLARLKHTSAAGNWNARVFEYPLDQWRDVSGSKLRIVDFLNAPMELVKIALSYRIQGIPSRYFPAMQPARTVSTSSGSVNEGSFEPSSAAVGEAHAADDRLRQPASLSSPKPIRPGGSQALSQKRRKPAA